METRALGSSDLKVSVVGLGCNNFGSRSDFEASEKVIHRALDAGINLFDTADIYGNRGGSEEIIGRVLGARRKEIVLATKFGGQMDEEGKKKGASAEYIKSAVEASLRRLQTDVIDLYQLHMPDPETPLEETLGALNDLVQAGKVRYIGCSNLPAWEVVDSLWLCEKKGLSSFVSCQDEYSLLNRDIEKGILPMCEAKGVGVLPYFPLASGLLTGKYEKGEAAPEGTRFAGSEGLRNRYMTERNWEIVDKLETFAAVRGHTILDLAFAWLLAKKPVSSVIAGATKPQQIDGNVKAGQWRLTPEEAVEVDHISAKPE